VSASLLPLAVAIFVSGLIGTLAGTTKAVIVYSGINLIFGTAGDGRINIIEAIVECPLFSKADVHMTNIRVKLESANGQ
jgi:hypothetical protein